jgi:hypothetical protein
MSSNICPKVFEDRRFWKWYYENLRREDARHDIMKT